MLPPGENEFDTPDIGPFKLISQTVSPSPISLINSWQINLPKYPFRQIARNVSLCSLHQIQTSLTFRALHKLTTPAWCSPIDVHCWDPYRAFGLPSVGFVIVLECSHPCASAWASFPVCGDAFHSALCLSGALLTSKAPPVRKSCTLSPWVCILMCPPQ